MAPETTAFDGSRTAPLKAPVGTCAAAIKESVSKIRKSDSERLTEYLISYPPTFRTGITRIDTSVLRPDSRAEFSLFPGVAHCDMNDPFEIEQLAPDNRLYLGGDYKTSCDFSSRDRVSPGAIWEGAESSKA